MSATLSANKIIIENEYIKKELFVSNKKICGFKLENKICQRTFEGNKSSEEFVVSFKSDGIFSKKLISASSLKIKKSDIKTENGKTVLKIDFLEFSVKDSKICLSLVYEIKDGEPFLKKHLEFSFESIGRKPILLDFIEFEKFGFDSSLMHWSIPKQKGSHASGELLELGQPVYIDSFYFGCEFPICRNIIEDSVAHVTYYNGKNLSSLLKDGAYKSYDSVVGVAQGNLFAQVQKAFFGYIRTISKPCCLRRQYNSWYDNMLNITPENVTSSFLEIEKGLTKYGEPVIDSFVADDGWNDYQKGFWCFNSKFPNGLTPFAQLSESLGSGFGLWLGPRGGYTTDTAKFAKKIEKAGNGYYNKQSNDICVASEKYVEKTSQLLIDFVRKYRINYFKLDGFAQKPCKSKNHDHITGGYKNMYFYTDVWEKWIAVFERLSENAFDGLWINLTCYAPPSAWFLKWVNSVWMQVSNDHGFIGKKGSISDKDGLLSYRDEMYFDFYENRQYQFPQMSIYNHDPIYGVEAKVKMSDEDFRSYLFTMATRGTSFWELYYSHSLMNEAKWRINHSVLRFVERNMSVLSHSVIFGARPSEKKCYGYACFDENEGILCLRNSGGEKENYSVVLDEQLGISADFSKKAVCTVLPYTVGTLKEKLGYGDELTVELNAFETRIYHFGKKARQIKANFVQTKGKNELEISFDSVVGIEKISCENNRITSARLLEDYMTVRLTFENAFSRENEYALSNVTDISGNSYDVRVSFDYNENGVVVYGIKGNSGFSIKATLDSQSNQLLMSQGDEVRLIVDEKGYAVFTVGKESLASLSTVESVSQIVAVRERNGLMKLYFDGKLNNGRKSENIYLKGETMNSLDKVKVLDRALSFDEV